ncbi:MAG: UDP-N-acetylmuramoyl-L-alanyl-D-glutamate--2,6-diaminopimelate ligase [Chloroflexota bacterium]
MHTSSLSNLFKEFPQFSPNDFNIDPKISFLTADSRKVLPGSLFVAMSGGTADGHRYIPSAISNGAVAIVGELEILDLPIPYIRVDNSRKVLAFLSAAFYDFPARKLNMIGVTGTDGKTTTSNIIYQILLAAGYKTGMISTVNAVIGSDILDTGFHVTTPDAPDVQLYLSKMVEAGLTHVVLETTSHGWAQNRVDACEFDIGVITNITHEHLDYHGTYENYRDAKANLFKSLSEVHSKAHGNIQLSVLNKDDSSYEFLKSVSKTRHVSYGLSSDADLFAHNIVYSLNGVRFKVGGSGYNFDVETALYGTYNIYNCLAAISVALFGFGIEPEIIIQGIKNLLGVPGRMERIDLGQEFSAFVDFAHTPNALKVSLETARKLLENRPNLKSQPGRLISVFGSAGLRDKDKRRMMAEVSAQLANISIITAEDPRTESLDGILQEMIDGAVKMGGVEGRSVWRVRDRGDAIRLAIKFSQPGDLVIACGKGHEQSMCFGTTEYLWDDRTAMKAALSEHLKVQGPTMPFLPTQVKP